MTVYCIFNFYSKSQLKSNPISLPRLSGPFKSALSTENLSMGSQVTRQNCRARLAWSHRTYCCTLSVAVGVFHKLHVEPVPCDLIILLECICRWTKLKHLSTALHPCRCFLGHSSHGYVRKRLCHHLKECCLELASETVDFI